MQARTMIGLGLAAILLATSGAQAAEMLPIGSGIAANYGNIPFEVYGCSLKVVHTTSVNTPTAMLDLQGLPLTNCIHVLQKCNFADNVHDGVVAGQIVVNYTDGDSTVANLIVGVNTAEWSYDRPEEQPYLQHSKIPAAYSVWTNLDSASYYWAHKFDLDIETKSKPLQSIEVVLAPQSYTGQSYYGSAPADWFGIDVEAVTVEIVPEPFTMGFLAMGGLALLRWRR